MSGQDYKAGSATPGHDNSTGLIHPLPERPFGDAGPSAPKERRIDFAHAKEFFLHLIEDEGMQNFLVRHFCREVIEEEMSRRKMVEPLLSCEELAEILDIKLQGLYKKLQHDELDIPYVPIGRGGGYKFDPKDVREFINKMKVHPMLRPSSLRKRT